MESKPAENSVILIDEVRALRKRAREAIKASQRLHREIAETRMRAEAIQPVGNTGAAGGRDG
ncbi:MAG: hypothetical protein AAGC57_03055 [Pseudomonadota bacterium]